MNLMQVCGCGLAAASAVAFMAAAMPSRDRAKAAAAVIGEYSPRPPAQAVQRPQGARWARALAVAIARPGTVGTLRRRVDAAGNPARWPVNRVLAARSVTMIVLAVTGALYGLRGGGGWAAAGALGGGVAGYYLPVILLYNTALHRRLKITAALPDAVDLLTICMEAGLGFDQALARVAGGTPGPLGTELERVLHEIRIGRSRADALRDMAARTAVPELGAFVSALAQATELGISVAQVLREQSGQMRELRRHRAEEKAQQVAVKILFPLIFCLFPALFIFVMGPGALSLLHAFGH